MAVNYGILGQIAAPQVVGQLPQQPNQVDSLAGGIMSGLAQGQQLKLGAQQQEMNQMKIDAAKQEQISAAQMRAQFQQGWEQGMAHLQQNDPVAYAKLQVDMTSVQKNMADAAKSAAETNKQQLQNLNEIAITGANLAQAAQQGRTPQEKQAIYNQYYSYLEKTAPQLAAVYPKQFDDNTYMILTKTGADAKIRIAEAEEAKNMSSRGKDAKRIADLQTKAQDGTITENEKKQLDILQQNQVANNPNTYSANLNKELGKVDAQQVKEAADLQTSMTSLHTDAQNALQQIDKVPDLALGPIAKGTKLDKMSPEAQQLTSSLNAMALQLKDYYKLGGGQGFTDADRDFLTEIAGNTGFYKYSLKEVVGRMDKIAGAARYNAWKKESNIRKQSSGYAEWLQANPEPSKDFKDLDNANKVTQQAPGAQPNFNPVDVEAEMKRRGLL